MNASQETRYVVRTTRQYERGRFRAVTRTHRAGCVNAAWGTWQPSDTPQSELPVCCRGEVTRLDRK